MWGRDGERVRVGKGRVEVEGERIACTRTRTKGDNKACQYVDVIIIDLQSKSRLMAGVYGGVVIKPRGQ